MSITILTKTLPACPLAENLVAAVEQKPDA